MDELASALGKLGLEESQKNVRKKNELIKLLKAKILCGHTCPSWFKNLPPMTTQELANTLNTYLHEFEDFAQRRDENESDLKYSAVETVSKRCIQAHIYTIQKNFEEVPGVISEAYKLIQYAINEKYISQDYADGLRYVVRGLEVFYEIENGSVEGTGLVALQKILDDLNAFDNLSKKNKAGVLALKQYYIGNMSRLPLSQEMQIDIIKEMIQMDPDNCEWHCCFYVILRFYRESLNKFGPPSEEERKAIQTAMTVRGAKLEPRLLISQIMCLAEIFRNDLNGIVVSPFRFGDNIFYSTDELVSFIRSQADDILSIDPMSVRSNINIAKIFSSILPFQYRDNNFAKVCIKRAILFHPTSSKANHRMAVYYLMIERNCSKALKYAKRAYESDVRNQYALLDTVRLYMQDINKHQTDLASTIGEVIKSSSYYHQFPRLISEILFTNAVYKVLDGKPNEVVSLILEAYSKDEKTTEYFGEIQRNAKRFKWDSNSQGSNILSVILQLLSKELNQCTESSRKAKLSKLYEAARGAEEKSRHFGYGGRGGRFRGQGTGSRGRGGYGDFFGHRDGDRGSGQRYSEGFSARGGFRGGQQGSSGFSGRGGHGRQGEDSEGFSGRGGFYRNTDGGYSRSNSYNSKDNWRGNANSDSRSNSGYGDERKKQPSVQIKSTDHYAILGVSKTATKNEIKKAYYKLAIEHHPDKNSHLPEKELLVKQEEMKRINGAWEALQNTTVFAN